jgi:hypothetical protein
LDSASRNNNINTTSSFFQAHHQSLYRLSHPTIPSPINTIKMKYFATIASLIAAVKAASLGNTDYSVSAGQTFTITWYDAQGEVTLDLRNGKSGDLKQLATIVAGATSDDGKGSFTWTVPSTFAGEGPYAIVITDGTGVNYSPQFPIEGAAVEEDEEDEEPKTTEQTTTAAPTSTAKSTASAANVPKPTTTAFEFQSSSSAVPTKSSTKGASTTLATKSKTTDTAKPTDDTPEPTTVPDGEGNAARMASPLALILVSVAAMFYLQ